MVTPPWHVKLPAPRASPLQLGVSDLYASMAEPNRRAGVDYLIVDVRRADMDVSLGETPKLKEHEVCDRIAPLQLNPPLQEPEGKMMIPGAINLPAQTFHQTLPSLLPILSQLV